MTDKQARKLDKLLETHKEARHARKVAAAARAGIKGVQGRGGVLAALASTAGAKAVEAELAALRAERRALKKLHAFAVKTLDRAVDKSKTAAGVAKPNGNGKKGGKADTAQEEQDAGKPIDVGGTSPRPASSRSVKAARSRKT